MKELELCKEATPKYEKGLVMVATCVRFPTRPLEEVEYVKVYFETCRSTTSLKIGKIPVLRGSLLTMLALHGNPKNGYCVVDYTFYKALSEELYEALTTEKANRFTKWSMSFPTEEELKFYEEACLV